MWKLGAKRRPGQISREEFEGGLKKLEYVCEGGREGGREEGEGA
jgi:hypothetical protein